MKSGLFIPLGIINGGDTVDLPRLSYFNKENDGLYDYSQPDQLTENIFDKMTRDFIEERPDRVEYMYFTDYAMSKKIDWQIRLNMKEPIATFINKYNRKNKCHASKKRLFR